MECETRETKKGKKKKKKKNKRSWRERERRGKKYIGSIIARYRSRATEFTARSTGIVPGIKLGPR